jgi:hypothetical protein
MNFCAAQCSPSKAIADRAPNVASPSRREADKFFTCRMFSDWLQETFRGKDHSADRRHLDVVVIECDSAREVGGKALRSRPEESVPRYSTGKQ